MHASELSTSKSNWLKLVGNLDTAAYCVYFLAYVSYYLYMYGNVLFLYFYQLDEG